MPGTVEMTELVVRAQNGDMDAFNDLYNASSSDLETVGYGILHKKEDVEDAMQETYITIYRSFSGQGIAPLQKPESYLPWAKRIMKNTCLTQLDHKKRKSGKDELRPMNSEEDKEGMDTIDNADDDRDFSPEDAVEAEYIRSLIATAMEGIPAIRQMCLALHQQGLSYHEIGEQLSIPEGTAKSHVRYARVQLQKVVKQIEEKEHVQMHGIVLLPLANGKVEPLVRVTSSKKAAKWIAADTAAVAGTAKAVIPAVVLRRKIVAIVLAIVVAAGAAGIAVSQSQKAESTKSNNSSQVVKDQNQQNVSSIYSLLNKQRNTLDPDLSNLKRDPQIEKYAQRRAKQYAEKGEQVFTNGDDQSWEITFEDHQTSSRFELPSQSLKDKYLGSDVPTRVGMACYKKGNTYYWVEIYAE